MSSSQKVRICTPLLHARFFSFYPLTLETLGKWRLNNLWLDYVRLLLFRTAAITFFLPANAICIYIVEKIDRFLKESKILHETM